MTATPEQAIAAAVTQSKYGPAFGIGLCLQRVRMCYGVGPRDPDASTAWALAKYRHTQTNPVSIPRGVPVFWTGGSSGHGHIAIATGDGTCWSTDIRRTGYFDRVPIAEIHDRWGLTLVGWTEDINGVRVWSPPAPPKPEPIKVSGRVKVIRRAAHRAKVAGHDGWAARLTRWADALEKRAGK